MMCMTAVLTAQHPRTAPERQSRNHRNEKCHHERQEYRKPGEPAPRKGTEGHGRARKGELTTDGADDTDAVLLVPDGPEPSLLSLTSSVNQKLSRRGVRRGARWGAAALRGRATAKHTKHTKIRGAPRRGTEGHGKELRAFGLSFRVFSVFGGTPFGGGNGTEESGLTTDGRGLPRGWTPLSETYGPRVKRSCRASWRHNRDMTGI
jgi:hypothetical protein